MSTLKKKILPQVRNTELDILIFLLSEHIEGGSYFGRQDQHYKMCETLLKKLEIARLM